MSLPTSWLFGTSLEFWNQRPELEAFIFLVEASIPFHRCAAYWSIERLLWWVESTRFGWVAISWLYPSSPPCGSVCWYWSTLWGVRWGLSQPTFHSTSLPSNHRIQLDLGHPYDQWCMILAPSGSLGIGMETNPRYIFVLHEGSKLWTSFVAIERPPGTSPRRCRCSPPPTPTTSRIGF